jgi:hypothetical protein
LKEWLDSKKQIYSGDRVQSFFWKALECELCKVSFESKLKSDLYKIVDFERPVGDHMIMESVQSAPAKVVHVFNLNSSRIFKVGRSIETDMKIADISVSRVHAIIKIEDNFRVTVQDNGSKFGTLLKLVRPVKLC